MEWSRRSQSRYCMLVGAVAFGAAIVAILAAKAGTQDAYEEVALDLQQKA